MKAAAAVLAASLIAGPQNPTPERDDFNVFPPGVTVEFSCNGPSSCIVATRRVLDLMLEEAARRGGARCRNTT